MASVAISLRREISSLFNLQIGSKRFKAVQVNESTGSNLENDNGAFVGSRGVQRFPYFRPVWNGIKADSKLNEVARIVSHRPGYHVRLQV